MDSKLIQTARMTKKFLFSLDEGLYIVSGIMATDYYNPPGPHEFMEYVASRDEREAQWKRIKEVYSDGRTFMVFKDEADFCLYEEDFIKDNLHRSEEFGWA